jgi:hypothetical protein
LGEVSAVGVLGYLDANSGSMIVSAVAAGAAGAVMAVKMGFGRTLGKLSPKRRKAMAAEAEARQTGDVERA